MSLTLNTFYMEIEDFRRVANIELEIQQWENYKENLWAFDLPDEVKRTKLIQILDRIIELEKMKDSLIY